jgi:hypothetical protein
MKTTDSGTTTVVAGKAAQYSRASLTPRSSYRGPDATRGFALFWVVAIIAFFGTFTITLWGHYQRTVNPVEIVQAANSESLASYSDTAVLEDESSTTIEAVVTAHQPGLSSGAGKHERLADTTASAYQGNTSPADTGLIASGETGQRYEATYTMGNTSSPPTHRTDPIDIADPTRAISGRILDRSGNPLPGAAVTATAKRLFGNSRENPEDSAAGDPAPVYQYNSVSREDGSYAFTDLADGDYLVKATYGSYPPAQITVRTGVSDVNLVLSAPHLRYVQGTIQNTSGQPIAGVKVLPNLPAAKMIASDANGIYKTELPLSEQATPDSVFVRFRHADYRDQVIRITKGDWNSLNQARFDITMEPVNDVAAIAGTVRSTSGIPVSGETVALQSPGLRNRYTAVTDSSGTFLIQSVDLADDYSIAIRPRGIYKDYTYTPISIRSDLMNLDIALEPLDTAVLDGQMIDAQGRPIPGFRLQLRGAHAAAHVIEVTGDAQGHFRITNAPRDNLLFETWSFPQFQITNIKPPDKYDLLPLVLDWGDHEIRGQVQNSQGKAVSASQVQLTWAHTYNGIRSVATRKTITDSAGNFRFSQVGSGQHMLSIDSPGFESSRVSYDTGIGGSDEIVIRLQSKLL